MKCVEMVRYCTHTDANLDTKGLQSAVCCPRCMVHNQKIDATWTRTSHLRRTWPTNEERLAAGIHRTIPEIYALDPTMATTSARKAATTANRETLLAPFEALVGVLRNCHHLPTLSEAYRTDLQSWDATDRRLRFIFIGSRLSNDPKSQSEILQLLLGKSAQFVKDKYPNHDVTISYYYYC